MIIAIIIAVASGATRTLGRMLNALLAERIGVFQSTFYTYLLGLVCSLIALLFSQEQINIMVQPPTEPVWIYAGGFVGVLFIVLSNITAPHISAFAMTLLIFVGQISMGIMIDFYLYNSLSLAKIVGGLLILAGLVSNTYLGMQRKREQAALA